MRATWAARRTARHGAGRPDTAARSSSPRAPAWRSATTCPSTPTSSPSGSSGSAASTVPSASTSPSCPACRARSRRRGRIPLEAGRTLPPPRSARHPSHDRDPCPMTTGQPSAQHGSRRSAGGPVGVPPATTGRGGRTPVHVAREEECMGHLRESFHINAPIDHVWDLGADARRMPEYDANTIEVQDCPDRIDWVGAKYTSVSRVMGRRLTGTNLTTKVDRPRLIEQEMELPGGGHAKITIELAESGGGTDQTMTIDY